MALYRDFPDGAERPGHDDLTVLARLAAITAAVCRRRPLGVRANRVVRVVGRYGLRSPCSSRRTLGHIVLDAIARAGYRYVNRQGHGLLRELLRRLGALTVRRAA